MLCLRTTWLGPFSELGNLLTVSDLSSLRPSSSDELFSRGFGGRGGGTPGLRVELKGKKGFRGFRRETTEGDETERRRCHSQLHVFKGVFQVSDVAPAEDRQRSQESVSNPSLETKANTCIFVSNKLFF